MRGLLQKRSYLKARGETLAPGFLIFGARSSKEDLFPEEIKEFFREGALTKVFWAYSREPGMQKEYTSDKIRSDRVRPLLARILAKANAHVFICGSASMAGKFNLMISLRHENTNAAHLSRNLSQNKASRFWLKFHPSLSWML